MKVRLIKSERDLIKFQEENQRHIGVLFPIEYLRESRAYGMYHNNQLMGGYLIKTKSQLRTLQGLPDNVYNSFLNSYKLSEVCEITGLWIHPSLRKSTSSRRLIMNIALRLAIRPKKHFVYTYSKKCAGLEKLYSLSKPKRIYEGYVKQLPGMNRPDEEIIEIASSIKAGLNVIKIYTIYSFKVSIKELFKLKTLKT